MKPATTRQLEKLAELQIEFYGELDFDEAAEMIREHLPASNFKPRLGEHALMERSEPDGDQ